MSPLSASELAHWFSDFFQGLPGVISFDFDGVVIDWREANITYFNYLWE